MFSALYFLVGLLDPRLDEDLSFAWRSWRDALEAYDMASSLSLSTCSSSSLPEDLLLLELLALLLGTMRDDFVDKESSD
jgi:hypothetical protein